MKPWLAILVILALTGCGRKATMTDCEFIIDRNVEVQMRSMGIADLIQVEKRKLEIRGEEQTKTELRECVGKRVTDGFLACVKKADTTAELDLCTR